MIENIIVLTFFIQHYSILWLHLIDFLCRKQIISEIFVINYYVNYRKLQNTIFVDVEEKAAICYSGLGQLKSNLSGF